MCTLDFCSTSKIIIKKRKPITKTIYDFAQTTLSNLKQKSKEKKCFCFLFLLLMKKNIESITSPEKK